MGTSKNYTVSPYIAPVKGLNYAIPGTLMKDTGMTDCRNVHIDRYNCVAKRSGYKTFGNNVPLDGIVLGMDQLYTTAGNNYLVAATSTNLYYYNTVTSMWENQTRGAAILDTGEAAWTASAEVTSTADATIFAIGSKSSKNVIGAAFTTGLASYKTFTGVDASACTQFHVMVYSTVATSKGDLWLGVSETNDMGGTPVYFEVPALTAATWTNVTATVDKDDAAIAFGDLNAILSVGLYVNTDLGAMTVYVDDFRAVTKYAGTTSYPWFMDIMDDDLLLTNYIDDIQLWDTVGTAATALTTSPPKAKSMLKYKNYLVLGDVNDGTHYPQRIQWCDTGDKTEWSTGNAGYADLLEGVDWIVGLTILNDKLVVFKERSIYTGYLVDTTDIFAFDLKISGLGAPSPGGIINLGDEIIFFGWDNIYAFNGLTVEAIGDEVKDEIFNIVNPAKIYDCHSQIIEELDEIHFFFAAGDGDYGTVVFIYNYLKKAWTRDTRSNITKLGFFEVQTTRTWDTISGTWDAQNYKWDDRSLLASAPTNLLGDSSGNVFEWDYTINAENSVNIDGYVDTKDFVMDQWDIQKYWMRLDFVIAGDTIDIYYSIDEGDTWVSIKAGHTLTPLYATHKVDFRVSSEKIRFRFRNANAETFSLRMYTLYYTPGGRT